MDVHIARGTREQTFDVVRSYAQRPPLDTQLVCNLIENPNDTRQYVVEVD